MTKYVLITTFVCIGCLCYVKSVQFSNAPDLRGKYCEARTHRKCCPGRLDDCSAPILNTLCYCDDFCNRTRNDDCCPDYWTYCKGLLIPEEISQRFCYDHGISYREGEPVRINCNSCNCQELNGRMELLCEKHKCLVDEETVDLINRNSRSLGWKAANYSEFWGRRYEEGISSRLGVIHSKKKVLEMMPISMIFDPATIPRSFDARVKWPGIISKPRDQGWCGASWVFSTVSVASDRFAIMTYGDDKTFLSPQHLLNCNRNQKACNGGHLTRAWTFIRKYGLVPESCYPWEGTLSECKIRRYKKVSSTMCPAGQNQMLSEAELHRVGPAYSIAGEQSIMYEIMTSGPVQATMRVSGEFFTYTNGIFRCVNITNSDRSAYHAVKIIGWGEELKNNQLMKYWIVANSWGEWWGENGYFRIQRGVNECSIEEFVIAAWANVEKKDTLMNTIRQSRFAKHS